MTGGVDSDPMKIGVIGVGSISDTYLRNLTGVYSQMIEVVGCSDLILERSEKAKRRWDLPITFESTQELLADPVIEAVVVLTTPDGHFDTCWEAVSAGKHVYVEKPLCLTVEQGRALVSHAQAMGVQLSVAPDTCLGRSHQVALEAIDDGLIGHPVAASAVMLCHGHESWHPNPSFFYRPGAGPLLDMGPYYITALVSLMGSVVSVQGAAQTTFFEREVLSEPLKGTKINVEVPTHVAALLQFESRSIATLVTSFDVWDSKTPHIEIHGSLGSMILPNPNWFDGEVLVSRFDDRVWRSLSPHVNDPIDRRGLGAIDLVRAVRVGQEPLLSGSLGLHVLEVMEAIAVSAESGERIEVSKPLERIRLRDEGRWPTTWTT